MINSKKMMIIAIFSFILILLLGVTTYAFFNYTRTGSSNVIKVGRIYFNTRETKTIDLSNMFPIDPTENGIMDDETKVGTIEIFVTGDTDYGDGIEYLISAVNSNMTTSSNKIVPINLDFTVTGLGNQNNNYFSDRNNKNETMYRKIIGNKLEGNGMLLVGFIKPNTTSGTIEGIDGKITIKAYLDKNNILISDTYDGTMSDNMGTTNELATDKTVITTDEWNALQQSGISFKIKVEANNGIWVTATLEGIMKQKSVLDNKSSEFVSSSSGIYFDTGASNTNGKGIYERANTSSNLHPIYYYRGAIEDNNVLFANKCWKAVRTTDTGGVKLLYNGEYPHRDKLTSLSELDVDYHVIENSNQYGYDSYSFVYDSDNKLWKYMTGEALYNAKLKISFDIEGDYKIVASYYYDIDSIEKNESTMDYEYDDDDNKVFYLNDVKTTDVFTINSTQNEYSYAYIYIYKYYDSEPIYSCANTGDNSIIKLNIDGKQIKEFNFNNETNSLAYAGYMYGDVYEYNLVYQEDVLSGAYYGSDFTYDGSKYQLINPVQQLDNSHHYSCNLTDSEGKCEQIRYYYRSNSTANFYILLSGGDSINNAMDKMFKNEHNSSAKEMIDTWYMQNMSEFTNKLDDVIWCGSRYIADKNGWSTYGNLSSSLKFRNSNTWGNILLDSCRKNDSYTVNNSNGNMSLTYPIALLEEKELILTGGALGNRQNYDDFMTIDPWLYDTRQVAMRSNSKYIRPVIAIKPGQLVIKGDGTVNNPYIIE